MNTRLIPQLGLAVILVMLQASFAQAPAGNTPAPGTPETQQSPPSSSTAPAQEPSQPETGGMSRDSHPMEAGQGGRGMVWLNTHTRVYSCPGTRFYGKTKAGEYMTEAEARRRGARPDRGQTCGGARRP